MTTVFVPRRTPPTTHDYGAILESLLIGEQCDEKLAHRIANHIEYGASGFEALVRDIRDDKTFTRQPALWMTMSDFLDQMSADTESWRPSLADPYLSLDEHQQLLELHPKLERACRRLDDLLNRLTS